MPKPTEGYPGQPADLGRDRGAGPSPAFAAHQWARQARVSASAKAMLRCLLDHLNWRDGRCDPGQDRIARETGFSVATIRRATRELEQAGLIETAHDYRYGLSYRIKIGAVVPQQPHRPRKDELDLGQPAARSAEFSSGPVDQSVDKPVNVSSQTAHHERSDRSP